MNKEIKHYTPEMARKESKNAFNWRDYIQPYIDKYVSEACKQAKYNATICIHKPDDFCYNDATEKILEAARSLGWIAAPSGRTSPGSIYIELMWDEN